jgi:hypothetical protein
MDFRDLFDQSKMSWMDQAACANIANPDIFFPPRDREKYRIIAAEAKVYCLGGRTSDNQIQRPCPVRGKCLWGAIQDDKTHGIWGGLSHRERNALVRKWNRQFKDKITLEEYIYETIEKKVGPNRGSY